MLVCNCCNSKRLHAKILLYEHIKKSLPVQLQRVDIYPVMFVFSCCRISSMLRRWLFSVSIMELVCFRPTNGMRRLSSDGVSKEKPGRDFTGSARTAWILFVYTTRVRLMFIIWKKVFQIKYALWTIERENWIVWILPQDWHFFHQSIKKNIV